MISIFNIILLLVAHYVADFICQTNYMAVNKSKSLNPLLLHIFTYSVVLYLLIVFLVDPSKALIFVVLNGLLHLVIDFCTSKITASLKAQNKFGSDTIPNLGFFSVIGLDQLLHYICLFTTFWYIFK